LSSPVNWLVVGDRGKLFSVTYTHSKEQQPPVAAGEVGLGLRAPAGAVAQADYRILVLGGFQGFG